MTPMTRTERLLRLARQRGDRAAELILQGGRQGPSADARVRRPQTAALPNWSEAELREAWGR